MGKIFGVLLVVVALWVGLEVYTEGVRGAFGGVFASLDPTEQAASREPERHRWAGERAGDALRRAHETTDERRERQLGR